MVNNNYYCYISLKNYETTKEIYSILKFQLPNFNIMWITIFGIITGLSLVYQSYKILLKVIDFYYKISCFLLNKIFIIFIPIYIIGTILKTVNEINFVTLIYSFGKIIFFIFCVQSIYIFFIFFIGSKLHFNKCMKAINNTLPALFVGFSSMSSLVTLPVTLKAAELNIKDCSISRLIITSTVNCHDIGDCISLPLVALTIIYYFNGVFPEFSIYLYFAFLAALAQFSAVSVPGGSIVVLLPILIKYLGFTEEMGSFIMIISICIEPIGTAANIAGNSALAIIMSKLLKILKTR